jgi:hypothetical protein
MDTNIRWSDFDDAYGPATKIPALLENIRTSSTDELAELFDDLYSRALHQGSIFSASPLVAAALAEIAPQAPDELKASCYEMLAGFTQAARQALADGRTIPCHAGGDPEHGEAIRVVILDSSPSFASDLDHPVVEIRRSVAEILTAFEGSDAASAQAVRRRYLLEPAPLVRQTMLTGLVRTRGIRTDWLDFLDAALDREQDPAVRFTIFSAQVVEAKSSANESLVNEMVQAFVDGYVPYSEEVDDQFFEALSLVGTDREIAALLRALDLAQEHGLLLKIAERLLRTAFGDKRTGWGQTASSYLTEDGSPPRVGILGLLVRSLGTLILWKLSRRLARRRVQKQAARRVKGIPKIDYWGVLGYPPEMPKQLNEIQRRTLDALINKEALWQFRTNLWTLFQLPDNPIELCGWIAARG